MAGAFSKGGAAHFRGIDDQATSAQVTITDNEVDFQGNDVTGVGSLTLSGTLMHRDVTNSFVSITGGNSGVSGGNITVYGGGHATLAGDVALQSGGLDKLRWDNSAAAWDFRGHDITGAATIKPNSYTVATVPSASGKGAGAQIYVTDETGGATGAESDGTNWRRYADRAVIS